MINEDKTKIMVYNTRRAVDIMPQLTIGQQQSPLEVVEKFKLLGVIITSDLSWHENMAYMVGRAFKKLWIITRLKQLNVGQDTLKLVYCQTVHPMVEYNIVVWQSGITVKSVGRLNMFNCSMCGLPSHPR